MSSEVDILPQINATSGATKVCKKCKKSYSLDQFQDKHGAETLWCLTCREKKAQYRLRIKKIEEDPPLKQCFVCKEYKELDQYQDGDQTSKNCLRCSPLKTMDHKKCVKCNKEHPLEHFKHFKDDNIETKHCLTCREINKEAKFARKNRSNTLFNNVDMPNHRKCNTCNKHYPLDQFKHINNNEIETMMCLNCRQKSADHRAVPTDEIGPDNKYCHKCRVAYPLDQFKNMKDGEIQTITCLNCRQKWVERDHFIPTDEISPENKYCNKCKGAYPLEQF